MQSEKETAEESVKLLHYEMVKRLSNHVDPSWDAFVKSLNTHLSEKEIDNIHNIHDACSFLLEKGLIRYGQYSDLNSILSAIRSREAIKTVNEFTSRIQNAKEHYSPSKQHEQGYLRVKIIIVEIQPKISNLDQIYTLIMKTYNNALQKIVAAPSAEEFLSLREDGHSQYERSLRLMDTNLRQHGVAPCPVSEWGVYISLRFNSREALDNIWDMYNRGELLTILQEGVITPYILDLCQSTVIKLNINISDHDYKSCLNKSERPERRRYAELEAQEKAVKTAEQTTQRRTEEENRRREEISKQTEERQRIVKQKSEEMDRKRRNELERREREEQEKQRAIAMKIEERERKKKAGLEAEARAAREVEEARQRRDKIENARKQQIRRDTMERLDTVRPVSRQKPDDSKSTRDSGACILI